MLSEVWCLLHTEETVIDTSHKLWDDEPILQHDAAAEDERLGNRGCGLSEGSCAFTQSNAYRPLLDSVMDLWNAGMGLDCATCCLDGSVSTLQSHFCNKDLFWVACGKNFFWWSKIVSWRCHVKERFPFWECGSENVSKEKKKVPPISWRKIKIHFLAELCFFIHRV